MKTSFREVDEKARGRRGTAPRLGSLDRYENEATDAAARSLPAGVVEQQCSDDRPSLQVQPAEIGEAPDTDALEKSAAVLGVVEAHECGEKSLLAGTHDADGVIDQLNLGTQVPHAGGVFQV